METTTLVGYFKLPLSQGGSIHLFFKEGSKFNWVSCYSYMESLENLRFSPGVKIFGQEPEFELYQAKTWEDAKKWF